MSRITLSGNASGTGNFTLASPNSNTDRTLTLPDATGTVVVSGASPALGGVYLGGTGSANLLDDYEEGTWTPTVASGSLNVTGARYTKIGSLVTLFCDFTVASGGSSIIEGIPFACNVTTGMSPYQSGQDIATSRSSIALAIAASTIYVRSIGDNIAFSATNLTTGAVFHFTLSYDTTA
jgi:hypothetical protein